MSIEESVPSPPCCHLCGYPLCSECHLCGWHCGEHSCDCPEPWEYDDEDDED